MEPHPGVGRSYEAERVVGLADADRIGRCRLDAIARFCQDVANDDWVDAAPGSSLAWLVRRMEIYIDGWPQLGEALALQTWGSGVGRRWAERRTRMVGRAGSTVETVAIWVCVDPDTGRPAKLPAEFHDHFVDSAAGRSAEAKLRLPVERDGGAAEHRWPTRSSDLDVVGHVNNAIYWAMVEELYDLSGSSTVRAVTEHREPLTADASLFGPATVDPDTSRWWSVGPDGTAAVGEVTVR